MLVLSRKQGEEIRISRDIMIRIIRLDGNRVRIGIEAPTEFSIVRPKIAPTALPASGHTGPTSDNVPLVPLGVS